MRLVELSHPIEAGMVTYPGLPGPVLSDHLSREASRKIYAPGTSFQIGRIEMVATWAGHRPLIDSRGSLLKGPCPSLRH